MTNERLTDELAARALGWRPAPDRYVKSGRSWIPRSKFRPFVDVRDAFRLLDAVTKDYSLISLPGGGFSAEVRLAGRVGRASGEPKARAISLAVARAMELDVAPEAGATSPKAITVRTRGGDHGK